MARILPNHMESERSVLGCVLINPESMAILMEIFGDDPKFFHEPVNQKLYSALIALQRTKAPIDIVSVSAAAKDDVDASYIVSLVDIVPTSANVRHYAGIVADMKFRRDAIRLSETISDAAFDTDKDIKAESGSVSKHFMDISMTGLRDCPVSASEASDGFLHHFDRDLAGEGDGAIPTGIHRYDKITGGLKPGTLNIVAARPGVGKTALAANFAYQAILAGHPVLFFSMEMKANEVMKRLVSIACRKPYNVLSGDFMREKHRQMVQDATERIRHSGLVIDDFGRVGMHRFTSLSQKFARENRGKTPLVILDYIQLFDFGQNYRRGRHELIGDLTREAKILSNELSCPIVLLSQLSREADGESDPFKCMNKLKESGSIEQDANTITIMLKDKTDDVAEWGRELGIPDGEIVSCAVTKNREGEVGYCPLYFNKQTQEIQAIIDYEQGKTRSVQEDIPIEYTYNEGDDATF